MTTTVERAQPADSGAIFHLVEQNNLPLDGLREHLGTTIVARQDGRIVGTAALEVYADGALLRSVAVAPDLHRRGLGHRLANAAIQLADQIGVPAVYLLTTTAEQFFPRFGFERIDRAAVPAGVQQSVEFRSACPSTAVVMKKSL